MGRHLVERVAVGATGLALLLGSAGCQNEAAPGPPGGSAPAKAAQPAGSGTSASSPQPDAAAGGAADQAADQLFALLEKLGPLIDQSKAGDKLDCKKLGEALARFVQDNEAALAKLRESGGGRSAVDQALKKRQGEKAQTLLDKILEATDVDCNGEQSVRDGAKKLAL
jgi:hypothetical protein